MNEHSYDRGKLAVADAEQQAHGVLQKASQIGAQAADDAKAAASEAASSIVSQVRSTLDDQVESAAAYVGHAASSVRCASEDLTRNAPALANLVEAVADKLDGYAEGLKGKSADEIWAEASSFTRRQPALVFGLAAVAGFLAYRTIKSSGSAPSSRTAVRTAEEFHGA